MIIHGHGILLLICVSPPPRLWENTAMSYAVRLHITHPEDHRPICTCWNSRAHLHEQMLVHNTSVLFSRIGDIGICQCCGELPVTRGAWHFAVREYSRLMVQLPLQASLGVDHPPKVLSKFLQVGLTTKLLQTASARRLRTPCQL